MVFFWIRGSLFQKPGMLQVAPATLLCPIAAVLVGFREVPYSPMSHSRCTFRHVDTTSSNSWLIGFNKLRRQVSLF